MAEQIWPPRSKYRHFWVAPYLKIVSIWWTMIVVSFILVLNFAQFGVFFSTYRLDYVTTMGCGASQTLTVNGSGNPYIYKVNDSWNKAHSTLQVKRGKRYPAKNLVVKRSGWKTVRIFVSSTFKDFHAEREVLVKKVPYVNVVPIHWNGNIILAKFSSLAPPEVVIPITSGATSDESFVDWQ